MFESPIEKLMGDELRYHGLNVWPQYPVGILRTDMMVSSRLTNHAIIVECDGAIWHAEPLFDDFRDDILTEAGWEVIRFRGSEIMSCVEGCALNIIDLYFPELREQISYVEVNADLHRHHRLFLYEQPLEEYYQHLWYKRAQGNRVGQSVNCKFSEDQNRGRRDAIRASLKAEHHTLKDMVRDFILKYSSRPEEYLQRLSEEGIL